MKSCVVYFVFNKKTIISELLVFAEYQKISWKKEKLLNVNIVDVEDVPQEMFNELITLKEHKI